MLHSICQLPPLHTGTKLTPLEAAIGGALAASTAQARVLLRALPSRFHANSPA